MTEFKSKLGLKLTNDQIVKMFDAMDIDKSGSIDYTEFIAAFLDTVVLKQEKYLKEAFQKIDLVIYLLCNFINMINKGWKWENKQRRIDQFVRN